MSLDQHLAALRRAGDTGDADLADATRLRVRRSLEARSKTRRRMASGMAALGVLLFATTTWALATGQLQELLHRDEPRVDVPRQIEPPVVPADVATPRVTGGQIVPVPVQRTQVVDVEMPPPVRTESAARIDVPRPVRIAPPAHVEPPVVEEPRVVDTAAQLYRHAHDLHFHGADPAAALAAWDGYLAAAPDGKLAVEARYNRGICLVKLGRLAEAREVFAAFAEERVSPAGYRADEARALLKRIELNTSRPSGDDRP